MDRLKTIAEFIESCVEYAQAAGLDYSECRAAFTVAASMMEVITTNPNMDEDTCSQMCIAMVEHELSRKKGQPS